MAFNFVVSNPEDYAVCAKMHQAVCDDVAKLSAQKKAFVCPDINDVLTALTDEAAFGVNDDICATIYNRYVTKINEAFALN